MAVRGLAVVRVAAGLAALVKLVDLLPALLLLAEPDTFRAPTVGLVPYPPPAAVWVLAAVWVAAAALLVAGRWDRPAAGVLVGLVGASLALDAQLYGNHFYLLGLVLLVWAAAPRDARVLSYRWLASVVYGFAAAAKLNVVYLSGGVLGAQLGHGSLLAWPEALRVWWLLAGLALVTLAAEAFLAVGLWLPRCRRVAVAVGAALHVGIIAFFDASLPIAVFTLLMLGLYSTFLAAVPDGSATRCSASPRVPTPRRVGRARPRADGLVASSTPGL